MIIGKLIRAVLWAARGPEQMDGDLRGLAGRPGAEPDDRLFSPPWVRAAVGAAAATAATEALRAIGSMLATPAGPSGGNSDLGPLLIFLVPLIFGAGSSLIADLDRDEPRYGLAAACGVLLAVSSIVFAVIWYDAIPLAAAMPITLRAILTPPPRGVDRVEFTLSWLFAGAFWPVLIGLGGGFVLHNQMGGGAVRELVYAGGSAAFGAIYTVMMIELDPDRVPDAPPLAPVEVAATAPSTTAAAEAGKAR